MKGSRQSTFAHDVLFAQTAAEEVRARRDDLTPLFVVVRLNELPTVRLNRAFSPSLRREGGSSAPALPCPCGP